MVYSWQFVWLATPGLFLAVCMVGYPWFILGSLYGPLPLVYSWQFVWLATPGLFLAVCMVG